MILLVVGEGRVYGDVRVPNWPPRHRTSCLEDTLIGLRQDKRKDFIGGVKKYKENIEVIFKRRTTLQEKKNWKISKWTNQVKVGDLQLCSMGKPQVSAMLQNFSYMTTQSRAYFEAKLGSTNAPLPLVKAQYRLMNDDSASTLHPEVFNL